MANVKIWVHAIWSTKRRKPLLIKKVRPIIFNHIRENARSKSIHLDFINGYIEHVHCLISLNHDQNISKVIQLIKGESSYWINKNHLTKKQFAWQDEYMAISVNPTRLNNLREYIKNQETHHIKKSFTQEYQKFINECSSDNTLKTKG
ncbi:MAG: IS200/IS605 family transposase [Bacteroidales bacterium]|nr:IS200/IS605 family transposase [Bacteroidales bacterium]